MSESTLFDTTVDDDSCWERRWASHSSAKFRNANSEASRCTNGTEFKSPDASARRKDRLWCHEVYPVQLTYLLHKGGRGHVARPPLHVRDVVALDGTRIRVTGGGRFGGHRWTLASLEIRARLGEMEHAASVKKCAQRHPEGLVSSQCLMLT